MVAQKRHIGGENDNNVIKISPWTTPVSIILTGPKQWEEMTEPFTAEPHSIV